jgi:acetyl esterase
MSLDPILKQLLGQIPALPPGPIDHPAVRAQADAFVPLIVGPAGHRRVGSVQDATARGSGGPVPIRIYRPVGAAQRHVAPSTAAVGRSATWRSWTPARVGCVETCRWSW